MYSPPERREKKRQYNMTNHSLELVDTTTDTASSKTEDKNKLPRKKRLLDNLSFFPSTADSVVQEHDISVLSHESVMHQLRTARNKGQRKLLSVFLKTETAIRKLSPQALPLWKDEVSGILFGLFSETADDSKRKKISDILQLICIEEKDIKMFESAIEFFCDNKINDSFAVYKKLAKKMKQCYFDNDDCDQSYLFFLLQAQLLRPGKTRPFGTVIQETNGRLSLRRSHTKSSPTYFGATKPDIPAVSRHKTPEKDKKTLTSIVSARDTPDAVITAAAAATTPSSDNIDELLDSLFPKREITGAGDLLEGGSLTVHNNALQRDPMFFLQDGAGDNDDDPFTLTSDDDTPDDTEFHPF